MRKKRDKQVCECTNNNVYTNNNEVVIEFTNKRVHECSTSRTLDRLFVLVYKMATSSRRRVVVRIQSALCEVACEENTRALKITVVKIYRTVISA